MGPTKAASLKITFAASVEQQLRLGETSVMLITGNKVMIAILTTADKCLLCVINSNWAGEFTFFFRISD